MKKRLLAGLLITMMVLPLMTSAALAEGSVDFCDEIYPLVNINDEICRALNSETDLRIANTGEASIEKSDGSKELVKVYTTTRAIEMPMVMTVDDASNGQIYATTTVATFALSNEKTDSNSVNDYYVTAYGTVYWRDNLGTVNEFLGASGGWRCDKDPNTDKIPKLSDAKVKMQGQGNARDYISKWFRNLSTTGFTIKESDFDYTRFSFWFDSYVTINGEDTLKLTVGTSILT